MNRFLLVLLAACSSSSGTKDKYATVEELLAAAPLVHPIDGTTTSSAGLSVFVPTGWTPSLSSDVLLLERDASPGCTIAVVAPGDAPPDEDARYATALATAQAVMDAYPSAPLELDAFERLGATRDPLQRKVRGRSPAGWTFAGLQLSAAPRGMTLGTHDITAYVAVFGESATVVVMVAPRDVRPCDVLWTPSHLGVEEPLFFHGLNKAGFTPTTTGLKPDLFGSWFLGVDRNRSSMSIFSANGRYMVVFGETSYQISGADLYGVSSAWAGDGPYVNMGPYLATFGKGGASTSMVRIREVWFDGGFKPYLCQTGKDLETCQLK